MSTVCLMNPWDGDHCPETAGRERCARASSPCGRQGATDAASPPEGPRTLLACERLWTIERRGVHMHAELAHYGDSCVGVAVRVNGEVQCERWFESVESALATAVTLCREREHDGWR